MAVEPTFDPNQQGQPPPSLASISSVIDAYLGRAPDLSIVIPAYNEAHKIARDVEAASRFLTDHAMTGEIIVADDGSRDGTVQTARACIVPSPLKLKVLAQDKNRGKGAAVRAGVLASRGEEVLFSDADLATPIEELAKLQARLANGCDIAIGSILENSGAGAVYVVPGKANGWSATQTVQ